MGGKKIIHQSRFHTGLFAGGGEHFRIGNTLLRRCGGITELGELQSRTGGLVDKHPPYIPITFLIRKTLPSGQCVPTI